MAKQALKQSTGAHRQQYESWRKALLKCLANVEAVIDFGEDEDIAEEVAEQVLPRVQQLCRQLQHHLVSGESDLTCNSLFLLCSSLSLLLGSSMVLYRLPQTQYCIAPTQLGCSLLASMSQS